uniref:Tripartite motif-containing protein 16-like n=1 Tax=Mola mola TaxID=94237 RepID=A0A3Q3WJB6_MOLML
MAQKGVQLDRNTFSCSICLDLLKDPVAIPCGHSYCMNCIQAHWDAEGDTKTVVCPQCRQTFTQRPFLVINAMLATLVEELKKTKSPAAPADLCYAGPEDVACDVCTGRKRKACNSCLVCLVSYCENHLQPHRELPPLKKHKLVEPYQNLQENICSRHDEVMKMFCRTDRQSICYLCSVDEHKGHDTVSAAAERTERQRELEVSRGNIQQRIQDREEDKKRSEVKQQVRSQQETVVSKFQEFQEELEQEIAELKRRDAELEKLSHTEDHNCFLNNYPSLPEPNEFTHSSSINIRHLSFFEDVTAAVSELREKLQEVLTEEWTNISLTVTEVDVLLPQPEPKTRADFLKYSREITLDPNTANSFLVLSEGNRKATVILQQQPYCRHPDRFTYWCQVLSKESLTGRCYWEVVWRGDVVGVAVAYKNVRRAGRLAKYRFGFNDRSWALDCYHDGYIYWHDRLQTSVSGAQTFRLGVYLDHSAGVLSFYSISRTMTLLHRVQTTFTQPLYAGLWFHTALGDSAEFCKPIKTEES